MDQNRRLVRRYLLNFRVVTLRLKDFSETERSRQLEPGKKKIVYK
jgi:hypothetical protein